MQLRDLFQILAYILNCMYSVSTILKMPVNHLKFVSFGRSSIHYSCVPYTQGRQLFQNSSSSANITSVNHLDIVVVVFYYSDIGETVTFFTEKKIEWPN